MYKEQNRTTSQRHISYALQYLSFLVVCKKTHACDLRLISSSVSVGRPASVSLTSLFNARLNACIRHQQCSIYWFLYSQTPEINHLSINQSINQNLYFMQFSPQNRGLIYTSKKYKYIISIKSIHDISKIHVRHADAVALTPQ